MTIVAHTPFGALLLAMAFACGSTSFTGQRAARWAHAGRRVRAVAYAQTQIPTIAFAPVVILEPKGGWPADILDAIREALEPTLDAEEHDWEIQARPDWHPLHIQISAYPLT